MASGTVIEAEMSGPNVRVTVEVDEGPAGFIRYTAEVRIDDLKALDTSLKRRNALVAAVKETRDKRIEEEAVTAQLANLVGAAVAL